MYNTLRMQTRLLVLLLLCAVSAHAIDNGNDITKNDRSKLIDRVNYCCTTGACSFQDMFTLKADAQSYLAGRNEEEDGFRKFVDTLLMGEGACKASRGSQRSLMEKRSESPVLERLSIPAINTNEVVRMSHLVVSTASGYEDGISSIYIFAQNASSFAGYAYITFDSAPPSVINTTFTFLTEFSVSAGVYNLTFTLTDNEGFAYTYDYLALLQMHVQSTVTYASGECAAGFYKPFNSSAACQACPQGSYSKQGAFVCQYCNAGTGVVGNPGTSCSACPAGTFSTGTTPCKQCPAGTYSQVGSYLCTPCAAGSYSAAGSAYCTTCAAGTYSKEIGQASCKVCPAGTYSTTTDGASSCTPCRPGTSSSRTGASTIDTCVQCAEGTYVGGVGAPVCVGCPPGMISPRGSTSILKCFDM